MEILAPLLQFFQMCQREDETSLLHGFAKFHFSLQSTVDLVTPVMIKANFSATNIPSSSFVTPTLNKFSGDSPNRNLQSASLLVSCFFLTSVLGSITPMFVKRYTSTMKAIVIVFTRTIFCLHDQEKEKVIVGGRLKGDFQNLIPSDNL